MGTESYEAWNGRLLAEALVVDLKLSMVSRAAVYCLARVKRNCYGLLDVQQQGRGLRG